MSTYKRIVVAAAIVVAIGTNAGDTSATTPPVPPTTSAGAPTTEFVLPPDYVQLTDDTASITVAVPNTWIDISTVPFRNEQGVETPHITAAPDYQVFHETFDAPGLEFVSLPYDPDQQALMTGFGLTGGCQTTATEPYDDGAFVGLHGIWSDCGATGTPEWHQLVVAPADSSRTLVLQIQITSQAELPILQNILASFNIATAVPPATTVAGVPTVPGSTVPVVPTVPTSAGPSVPPPTPAVPTVPTLPTPSVVVPTVPTPTAALPTVPLTTAAPPTVPLPTVPLPTVPLPTVPLPTGATPTSIGAVPAGFVPLADDSQSITIAVPATWTDVDTSAFVLENGTQIPQIFASTDRAQWESSFSVPGVRLREVTFIADSATFASELGLEPGSCPTEVVEPFTNGRFTGHIARYAECGSLGQAEYDVIVASPPDQSLTYVLEVQTTGPADQAAAAAAIATFGPVTGGATTSG